MRLREGELVATLAPVVGSDDEVEVEVDIPAALTGSDEAEHEPAAEEPPA
jgi:hypothetical protein